MTKTIVSRVAAASWQAGLGALGLVTSYFVIMRLATGGWSVGWLQFQDLWLYFGALIGSFSVSTFIQVYARLVSKGSMVSSAGAMIACCAHHVVDLVPLLGVFSTSLLFLAEWQKELLVIGSLANLAVAGYVVWQWRAKQDQILPV